MKKNVLYRLEKAHTYDLKKYFEHNELWDKWKKQVYETKFIKSTQVNACLKIEKSGLVTVYPGYEWDGNSPKSPILFGLFRVGTPDGPVKKGVPTTYYASLLHDILGQLSNENEREAIKLKGNGQLPHPDFPELFWDQKKPKNKKIWHFSRLRRSNGQVLRDKIYYYYLEKENFPLRKVYRRGLQLGGPFYNWLEKKGTEKLGLMEIPAALVVFLLMLALIIPWSVIDSLWCAIRQPVNRYLPPRVMYPAAITFAVIGIVQFLLG